MGEALKRRATIDYRNVYQNILSEKEITHGINYWTGVIEFEINETLSRPTEQGKLMPNHWRKSL